MLISLLVFIIVVGLLIYLVQIIPLPAPFQTVAMVLIVLIALIWLLDSFSGLGLGGGVRHPLL